MRIRSPGYPSTNLKEAIDLVDKIFVVSRQNVIDREAAVKDMGYSGLTGTSAKTLANLAHFDLIEKAGKGGLRVTNTAVKILHPRNQDEKKAAMLEAAYSPGLFHQIRENWPDGFVSENALRGYLMRNGFSSGAVHPAISSYMKTYGYLQQEGATESHSQSADEDHDQGREDGSEGMAGTDNGRRQAIPTTSIRPQSPPAEHRSEGITVLSGERVVFVEESGPSQYLKVVAAGDLDETMIEALEDYIKRQKKRLGLSKPSPVVN